MAQTTTNYGLLKPEATDSYNHLIYDNPNMDTIDAAMKANSDAAITSATCIKSGTTHTITRSNTDASVMKFTATGDWNSGDTMIIDGVTVSPYLMTGEALKTGAYLINSEVIIALSGTRATVLSNQSEAGSTYFVDTNVSYTANNVQDAIDACSNASGVEYSTGVSVHDRLENDIKFTEILAQSNIPTTATSYSCIWNQYRAIAVYTGNYGNYRYCIILPTSWFANTTAGTRAFFKDIYNDIAFEIYQNGSNAVYMKASTQDANQQVHIYGISKIV